MSKVETLEKEIEKLSRPELEVFRRWFAEFDSEVWDIQIEQDIAEGKLDRFAEDAIEANKRGEGHEI